MNVNLTPELEELVHEKVAGGLYNSASEVVREALRLLREQDQLRMMRLEGLRKEIALGLKDHDEGRSLPLNNETLETIQRRIREKAQAYK